MLGVVGQIQEQGDTIQAPILLEVLLEMPGSFRVDARSGEKAKKSSSRPSRAFSVGRFTRPACRTIAQQYFSLRGRPAAEQSMD